MFAKQVGGEPFMLINSTGKSTWFHRAWLGSGCIIVLIILAKSILGAINSGIWLGPTLAGLVGYVIADLVSGIYHWGVDNYGNENTPIFGYQIEAFQNHHKKSRLNIRDDIAYNLHSTARAITCVVLPIYIICNDPVLLALVGVSTGFGMFSQQFHEWAHRPKNKLPWIVVRLQDLRLLVSRSQHAEHHRPPYNKRYCIVSGIWNDILDEYKFFKGMEIIIYYVSGVRPRSWTTTTTQPVYE